MAPFKESHLLVLTLTEPLATFSPSRLRSAIFIKRNGLAKADLFQSLLPKVAYEFSAQRSENLQATFSTAKPLPRGRKT